MEGKKIFDPKWKKARSTSHARMAIADFVNENTDNLADWLHRVAYGVPKTDSDGRIIRDSDGAIVYIVKPDAAAAIRALTDAMEYHLPRLSRAESHVVTQVENAASLPMVERVGRMTTSEIRAMLAGSIEDVPHRVVEQIEPGPLPAWMRSLEPPTSD